MPIGTRPGACGMTALLAILRRWLNMGNRIGFSITTSQTGYSDMKDLITLIDAICDACDNPTLEPLSDGTTFCNSACALIAEAMGCKDLHMRTADQIIDFMVHSDEWSLVPMDKVQAMVNEGSLIIAGLTSKDLGQSHGHVVVCRPGKECFSGKWGKVPRILNIGKQNYIARAKTGPLIGMSVGVNEAFIPLPKFYAWRSTL